MAALKRRSEAAADGTAKKAKENEQSDTVTFDVGGKLFKVLREPTLSRHPTSLLKQFAEDASGHEPIFIDRNPDLFPYILDYHRNRKILLPAHVSAAAVRREAAFYGFHLTPEDIENDAHTFSTAGMLRATLESRLATIADEEKKAARLEMAVAFAKLHAACIKHHVADRMSKGRNLNKVKDFLVQPDDLRDPEGLPPSAEEDCLKHMLEEVLVKELAPWSGRHGWSVKIEGMGVRFSC